MRANVSKSHAAVFGATSAIVVEMLRAMVAERSVRLLLIGRDLARLTAVANDLTTRGAECECWAVDLTDPAVDWRGGLALRSGGVPWDIFLLGHGCLPEQAAALADGKLLAQVTAVNFTSHAVIAAACAAVMEEQEHGTLAVIGSVAGDRGRQSNYVYGSAKAGIAVFLAGLRHRFAATPGIRVVLLKPGLTDTPMTADLPKGPLFSSADKVGRLAWRAVRDGRAVAYLPGWWRWVMALIRRLPTALFHRTKL